MAAGLERGESDFFSCFVFWEILLGLAWLSFEGPDLGLAPERRAKSLAPVSSDLRTDKKGLALVACQTGLPWSSPPA